MMIKLTDAFIGAALALLSPDVPQDRISFVLSDSPEYVQMAERYNYPRMTAYGRTLCGPSTDGKDACLVIINSCLLSKENNTTKRMLEKTVTHEVAHVEDYFINGKMSGHNQPWKSIMRKWKQPRDKTGRLISACRKELG